MLKHVEENLKLEDYTVEKKNISIYTYLKNKNITYSEAANKLIYQKIEKCFKHVKMFTIYN